MPEIEEDATKASYVITYIIVKRNKPFTYCQFIKHK